jgi:MFS family permease
LVMGHRSKIRRRGFSAYALVLLSGLMSLSLGLPLPLAFLLGTVFLRGFAFTAFELIWTNMMQEFVPREALGRVASIDYLGSFALLPLGYIVAGSLTDRVGPQLVFLIGGTITVVVALLGYAHRAVRRVD